MKFTRSRNESAEGDLTPMIDMTFQLIAFFMVLINFSDADQNQRIKLPTSQIVKPPDAPLEEPIFVHLTEDGEVILGGIETSIDGAKSNLVIERNILVSKGMTAADATVIIRADANVQTGEVQKLIKVCQEAEFDTFALRAKEEPR